MSKELDILLIETILLEAASDSEKEIFDARIKSDKLFSELYEEQKLIHNLVIMGGLYDLDDAVRKYTPPKNNFLRNFLFGLATLILASSSFIFFMQRDATLPNKQNVPTDQDQYISIAPPNFDNKEEKTTPKPILSQISNEIKLEEIITPKIIDPEKQKVDDTTSYKLSNQIHEEKAVETKKGNSKTNNKHPVPPFVVTKCLLEFSYHISKSCENEYTGVITVDSLSGGINPYTISLNDEIEKTENYIFNDLDQGYYELNVKDEGNCDSTIEVYVDTKICEEEKTLVFSPEYKSLVLPLELDAEVEISIYAMSGNIVFHTNKLQGEVIEWDGRNLKGELLQQGVYTLLINNNLKKSIFYITLVR